MVGAYVCPRGVFAAECRRQGKALRIDRSFARPGNLETAGEAAAQLVQLLAANDVSKASVAIALRGFGVVHHVLQLPSSKPEVLAPVADRELRRLDPSLMDPVSAVATLNSSSQAAAADSATAQLVAAAPAATVEAFEQQLADAGHSLEHMTALPAAMNRLAEEFDHSDDVSAFVASLPDGPFLGFFLGGAMRLTIDPPAQGTSDDASALAEELELGATFLRQQFSGAELDRLTLVGAVDAVDDAEQVLAARVGVPAKRFALRDLTAAAHAGVGAVLDADSSAPLSLGGSTRHRPAGQHLMAIRVAVLVAALAASLMAFWSVRAVFESRRAATSRDRLHRIDSAPDSGTRRSVPAGPLDSPSKSSDSATNTAVARTANTPTVRAANEGRQLTAVLIADERRVAVIDDTVVRVGDVLRDGSRVSAIQPTGVWIIEKNGTWRLLTLSRGGR